MFYLLYGNNYKYVIECDSDILFGKEILIYLTMMEKWMSSSSIARSEKLSRFIEKVLCSTGIFPCSVVGIVVLPIFVILIMLIVVIIQISHSLERD